MTSGHKLNGFLSTPTSDEKSRDLFTNRSGFLHHSACLCICIGCLWSPLTISVNLTIGICLRSRHKTHYFTQNVLPTCGLFDLLCPKCQATNKLQNTRLCICIFLWLICRQISVAMYMPFKIHMSKRTHSC